MQYLIVRNPCTGWYHVKQSKRNPQRRTNFTDYITALEYVRHLNHCVAHQKNRERKTHHVRIETASDTRS